MKNKSTLNVALLKKVKQHILEEPNRLVMGDWVIKGPPGRPHYDYGAIVTTPKCGTVGCIAGWCCLLADGMETPPTRVADRATELLGLEDEPYCLFHSEAWHDRKLSEQFESSFDQKERAEIVAKIIDNFIAEGK